MVLTVLEPEAETLETKRDVVVPEAIEPGKSELWERSPAADEPSPIPDL
jgi:hypothetical protein